MPATPPVSLQTSECWVFDLDNTLYPASSGLMAKVSDRMTQFVSRALDLPADEARIEQKKLFREHGTTLRGLMERHGVDPHAFMSYVHEVDYGLVSPSPRLATALEALPGTKLVFTNASAAHAEKVLDRLGVSSSFDAIFDVAAASWLPKPQPAAYDVLIERHIVDPRAAVMVEDIAPNLKPAAAKGMTTLWVRHAGQADPPWAAPEGEADYIHHETDDLVGWLEALLAA